MKNISLSFGIFAGVLFIAGTLVLGNMVDGYNVSRQTVSEIGAIGSPLQYPYAVMLGLVSILSITFAYFGRVYALSQDISGKGLILVGLFGVLDAGFAFFPTPHPMHNIFGLLHLIAYFAPLAIYIGWRKVPGYGFIANISLAYMVCIIVGLFLNMSPMFAPKLYPLEYYGYVQRFLLYSYYLWLILLSYSIWREARSVPGELP